jgi:hypothetical protein
MEGRLRDAMRSLNVRVGNLKTEGEAVLTSDDANQNYVPLIIRPS